MLCLLKNARLPLPLYWLSVLLGWAVAIGWLFFVFVEQKLAVNILSGQTILVDLLLALPLVLFMAVILYALTVWLFKLMMILFFRQWVMMASPEIESDIREQEAQLGEDYWKKKPPEEDSSPISSSDQRPF